MFFKGPLRDYVQETDEVRTTFGIQNTQEFNILEEVMETILDGFEVWLRREECAIQKIHLELAAELDVAPLAVRLVLSGNVGTPFQIMPTGYVWAPEPPRIRFSWANSSVLCFTTMIKIAELDEVRDCEVEIEVVFNDLD